MRRYVSVYRVTIAVGRLAVVALAIVLSAVLPSLAPHQATAMADEVGPGGPSATLPATGPSSQPASAPATRGGQLDQETRRKYVALGQQLAKEFQAKDYAAAAATAGKLIEIAPRAAGNHYNLACALARLGRKDQALDALATAVENRFDDHAGMQQDEDLASIRDTARFKELVEKARKANYDPGQPIDGVRTVEGKPKDGLWYRVRMSPKATKDKPARLIVWLHPSGGHANNVVESMAADFIERGYALLVATNKGWMGWRSDEAAALARSIEDAAGIDGIDARRPVLLGFSAGGQMALMLYEQDPLAYGGLVLDAAYPVRPTATGLAQTAPPAGKELSKTPVIVFVGDKDNGYKVWQKSEPVWTKAGCPLKIVVTPGAGHQWVLGANNKTERKALFEWLVETRRQLDAATQPGASQPGER